MKALGIETDAWALDATARVASLRGLTNGSAPTQARCATLVC